MSVVIYTRVSSGAQTQGNHTSLDAQKQLCFNAAARLDKVVTQCYADIGSARAPHTLKNQRQMWLDLPNGSIVFVHSFDRIARNVEYATRLFTDLKKRAITVHSIMEPLNYQTPSGRHQLINIFNNAELDSGLKGERVKGVFDVIRAGGGCPGAAPYGSEIIPEPERDAKKALSQANQMMLPPPKRIARPSEHEQRVIAFVRALRFGTMPIKQINNLLRSITPRSHRNPFINLEIVDKDDTLVVKPEPLSIDYKNIALVLNDYGIDRRNKTWGPHSIKTICTNDALLDEDEQLVISLESLNTREIPIKRKQTSAKEKKKEKEKRETAVLKKIEKHLATMERETIVIDSEEEDEPPARRPRTTPARMSNVPDDDDTESDVSVEEEEKEEEKKSVPKIRRTRRTELEQLQTAVRY